MRTSPLLLLAAAMIASACGCSSMGAKWRDNRYRSFVRHQAREAGKQRKAIQNERARIPDPPANSDRWSISAETGPVSMPSE